MKEQLRRELQERIQTTFEAARGVDAPARRKLSSQPADAGGHYDVLAKNLHSWGGSREG
jgi:hypothetical protein